ncbi:MAG: DUF1284 domain-containing protein [Proteobacteria bacterium]|nr:DUF1284 domain-containing protein [Pseudomonadota bacterium]
MIPIHLRPHHGLCLLTFEGRGYCPEFVTQMAHLKNLLNRTPKTHLILTLQCDDLCHYCPHRTGNHCDSSLPEKIDQNVLSLTGLKAGQSITWNELRAMTRQILSNNLNSCCSGCEWLSICSKYCNTPKSQHHSPKIPN